MKNKNIKANGFDLDSTLFDERLFIESGFLEVSKYVEKKFDVKRRDFYNLLIKILDRDGRGKIFDSALKENDIYNKKLAEKLIDIYRRHNPKIKMYSGMLQLLKEVKKKYKTFLITDGFSYIQKGKIKALKLTKYFDVPVYTHDLNTTKPKLLPYKYVAKKLKIKTSQMVYIGDNPKKDFIGAKKLGITTIRFKKGLFKDLKLSKDHEADYETNNINKIKKILN